MLHWTVKRVKRPREYRVRGDVGLRERRRHVLAALLLVLRPPLPLDRRTGTRQCVPLGTREGRSTTATAADVDELVSAVMSTSKVRLRPGRQGATEPSIRLRPATYARSGALFRSRPWDPTERP